jgi:hypothetical protein
MTLKALRIEARGVAPEPGLAGSAVRKYSEHFSAGPHRAAGAGSAAVAASESIIDDPGWTDSADE